MTSFPITTMGNPNLEMLYAIAQVHWRVNQEGGTQCSPAHFHDDNTGSPWIVIYLDRNVGAGEIHEVAISIMLSTVAAETMLKDGASFLVRFDEQSEVEAEGCILAVKRAPPTPSDAMFHSHMTACTQPTTDIVRSALAARDQLTPKQADHISYMAGFTHYGESEAILNEFDMAVLEGLPSLIDRRYKTRHVKILLNDLLHEPVGLASVTIAEKYGSPIYKNRIQCREPGGAYISSFPQRGDDRDAYWAYMANLEVALGEMVTAVEGGPPKGFAERLVLHATRVPARNTAENLERLFCNVGVVVTAYENGPGYNLSFENLSQCAAIQPSLARALWVLLDTADVEIAVDAVKQIGAEFVILPYSKTRQDYLEEMADLMRSCFRNGI
jgi:hypothetical protein